MTAVTAKNLARALLLALGLCLGMTARAAADPSVDQVYQAAHSGHYDQAQSMMRQVLRDHPNSAKAHFVEAELLAGHGDLASARTELGKARSLNASLSFAKPDAVRSLESRLNAAAPARSRNTSSTWAWLIGALALVAVWLGVRSSLRRRAWNAGATGMGGPISGPIGPAGPMGPGHGPYGTGYGPGMPGATGGMGSGILGGLATGAAMGAGFAAGEALIDRALGNRQGSIVPGGGVTPSVAGNVVDPSAAGYDMGGNDFGLQDPGSWDAGSDASASADDWDTSSDGSGWDSSIDDSSDWS